MKDFRDRARVTAFLRNALAEAPQGVLKLEAMARREALLGEHQRITHTKAFKRAKHSLRIKSVRAGFGTNGAWRKTGPSAPLKPKRPMAGQNLGAHPQEARHGSARHAHATARAARLGRTLFRPGGARVMGEPDRDLLAVGLTFEDGVLRPPGPLSRQADADSRALFN